MFTAHRATFTTTLFATIVSALVLTSTQGQARDDAGSAASTQRVHPVVVHQLPRVVVTGRVQRAETARIVELPRVVVTGRRTETAPTWLSQLSARVAAIRS